MAPAPKTNTPAAPIAGKPEKAAARKPAADESSKPKKAAAEPATTKKPAAAEPATTKKPAAAAPSTPAAAEPVVPVDAAAAAAAVITVKPSATIKLVGDIELMDAKLARQEVLIKSLLDESRAVKELRKSIGRHSINAKKAEGVRVAKVIKRKALPRRGLNDPTLVSDTMNAFLGNAPGTKVPRQEAYAAVRAYVAANNLKEGAPSGFAKVDAKLSKLFVGMTEFQVFAIQQHLKDHFAKKDQAAPVAK